MSHLHGPFAVIHRGRCRHVLPNVVKGLFMTGPAVFEDDVDCVGKKSQHMLCKGYT